MNARIRRITLGAVFLAALVLAFFQVTDLDLGGHVTVGRYIVKHLRIPDTNLFSHTVPGHPYPVHQWLGQVILFGVHHVGGTDGLIALRMAVVLLGALLLYRNARNEGAPVVVAAGIVLLLLVAARPRFFARPFLVTLVFLPLLHSWVAAVRHGRTRRLWPIVPLITVWAHIHSGVLFGVLYLGATVAGEGLKILIARSRPSRPPPGSHVFPGSPLDGWNYRRIVLFSAAAVALALGTMALINPSGIKPLALPFLFYESTEFRRMILEYRPVQLGVDWPWELVAGAVALGMLLRPRRVDLTQLLVVVGFGVLAFQAVREIITFAAAAAPMLGRTWGSLAEDLLERIGRRGGAETGARRAGAAEATVAAAVVAAAGWAGWKASQDWIFPFGRGWDPKSYPQRTIDFLWAENIRGEIFNTDVWASALLVRGKGLRFPVFVDARLEAYPEDFWRDSYYRVLRAAPGWEEVLARYGVECAIVRRTPGEADDRIGDVLFESPDWGLVYWDDWAMLFLRRHGRPPRNAEVLESWEFTAFSPRRPQEVTELRGEALDRAVEELLRLVSWDPESFLPRWTLAAARTRQGKGEDAVDLYARLAGDRAARRNPAFDRSRAEAALVAGQRDDWAYLLRKAGGDPASTGERFDAAVLLGVAGKEEAAEAMYREVLAADPAHLDARNNLALLLARDRRTDEAMTLIGEALARAPEDPYYIASKGEILSWRGDPAGALAEFRRALDLLPAGDAAAREEVMRWILRLE